MSTADLIATVRAKTGTTAMEYPDYCRAVERLCDLAEEMAAKEKERESMEENDE